LAKKVQHREYLIELALVISFIKEQRSQLFIHIIRREENETAKATMEWKPKRRRYRGKLGNNRLT